MKGLVAQRAYSHVNDYARCLGVIVRGGSAPAGNHDRHVAATHIAAVDVEWRRGHYTLGPVLLRHEPDVDATRHVIAGHLHPGVRLPGISRSLPAFVQGSRTSILPAFASFSRCALMLREERMVVCRGGVLVEVWPFAAKPASEAIFTNALE